MLLFPVHDVLEFRLQNIGVLPSISFRHWYLKISPSKMNFRNGSDEELMGRQ